MTPIEREVLRSITLGDVLNGEIAAVDERALGRSLAAHAYETHSKAATTAGGQVAVVRVFGPLMHRAYDGWFDVDGYDAIVERFAAALSSDAEAVLLHIDSPGGTVAGCFEAVRRMRELRDAAGKPVVAYADELAASAAYAIACVADAGIYAPATAEVGSVGVIRVHMSEARALDKSGIDVSVFRSGSRKSDANLFEQLSDDARAALQASVDETGREFAKLVSEARGKSLAEVIGWKGAIFGAREAIRLGVADRVTSLDEAAKSALTEARRRRKEKAMSNAMVSIMGILGLAEEASEETVTAAVTSAARAEGERDRLVAALGAKGFDEALGVVDGLMATAAEHERLRREKAELEAAKRAAEADDLVRQGREQGKITPATAQFWREEAIENIERTRAKLAASPVAIDRNPPKEPASRGTVGKTWEDLSTEEKVKMQAENPEEFSALLAEFRVRNGRSR